MLVNFLLERIWLQMVFEVLAEPYTRKSITPRDFLMVWESCNLTSEIMKKKRMQRIGFMLFWLTATVAAWGGNGEMTGKVIAVIDGNTVEVADEDNQKHTIILAGIDCPELGQEFGDKARRFLEKMLLQKKVKVTFQGKDRRGNYLAVVMLDDDDPRVALLKEGLAWTAEKNPNPELEPYRTWAQQKGKGLWKDENPTPPWTYRRQQSMAQPKSS